MRVTERDRELIRDIALSHVLSRDQIVSLYFGSITRANTRLRGLVGLGLLKRLETPFFSQSLYVIARKGQDLLDNKLCKLVSSRKASPRYLEHALTVTDARIALTAKSQGKWLFEQQLWRTVSRYEVRPDGLLLTRTPVFVEVDLGHVSLPKFREKLLGYSALAHSGRCAELYGFSKFNLLAITTGCLRSLHLSRQVPRDAGFDFIAQPGADLGLTLSHYT